MPMNMVGRVEDRLLVSSTCSANRSSSLLVPSPGKPPWQHEQLVEVNVVFTFFGIVGFFNMPLFHIKIISRDLSTDNAESARIAAETIKDNLSRLWLGGNICDT